MQKILEKVRWFFIGIRHIFLLMPNFVWIALKSLSNSIVIYWKNSQLDVDKISDQYTEKAMNKLTNDYDSFVYWVCYAVASFLYLVEWLIQAWIIIEGFRLLMSAIF